MTSRHYCFMTGVAILALVSLALRLHHLDYESLWIDEIRQTSYYGNSLGKIVYNAATQQQMPLDYWIGHFAAFFSSSDFAVRLPAAVFGTLSVVAFALILAMETSHSIALVGGLIMSLLPFNIYFSQEARPYAISAFFLLLVLGSLNWAVGSPRERSAHFAIFSLSVLGFLFTRAFTPLIVTCALAITLIIFLLLPRLMKNLPSPATPKRFFVAVACIASVLLVSVIPIKKVLTTNTYGLTNPTTFDYETLIAAWHGFSLAPLWRSYVVQTDPIWPLLLPLLLASPVVILFTPIRKRFLPMLVLLLLLGSSVLELFVFKAKSTLPYRPPYAIFVGPLVLFLVMVVVAWATDAKRRQGSWVRLSFIIFMMVSVTASAHAALVFKISPKIKEDWRGLIGYLKQSTQPGDVLLFDTINNFEGWEPNFYGFRRYWPQRTLGPTLRDIPNKVGQLRYALGNPVLIIHSFHDYKITPWARHPILGGGRFDGTRLHQDPFLRVFEFKSLLVVRLKEPSGNATRDTLSLLERLLADLPPNSGLIEPCLAAAALAKELGQPQWGKYLRRAGELLTIKY